jgi:glucose/mannose-6-phosphate isomerase
MTTLADLTAADHADMLGAIRSLPGQFARGHEAAQPLLDAIYERSPENVRSLVVCGMGGSGVGADLLPAVFDTDVPVVPVKGYDLPSWVSDEDAVVCVSYSGNTSETLACFEQANDRNAVVAVITSGGQLAERAADAGLSVVPVPAGMQPRAAAGVLFGALASVAGAAGALGDVDVARVLDECRAGAQFVVDQHVDAGGEPDTLPGLAAARELIDSVVLIYGATHTVPVAWRWKAQVNENGKVPAFANAFPELDHNEIVGWERASATGAKFTVVELLPFGVSDAVRARFDITRDIVGDAAATVIRYEPTSSTRAAAVFELLAHGDFISAYLALERGVDPSPVERISALKDRLAGR